MGRNTHAVDGSIEPEFIGDDRRRVTVEFRDSEVAIKHDFGIPPTRNIVAPLHNDSVNQYKLVDRKGVNRNGSASSKSHNDRVHILMRDGENWWYVKPVAQITPIRGNSDYSPTQLDGLLVKTVFKRQGGRGSESGYHKRYKIERELIKSHDEVYLVEYRHEQGGSSNGSYQRIKSESVTRLEVSDDA